MSGVIAHRAQGITAVALVACATVLGACSTPLSSPTATESPGSSAQTASPSPTSSHTSGEPGRPYQASDVLAAMRASRRPGGVAQQLQTDEVAGEVAALLWTWDGSAWTDLAIGGACGPETCTLEITGSTDGLAGADAYSFSVATGGGDVQLVDADLHGYPPSLEPDLGAIAASGLTAEQLDGLALVGVRWLTPPESGRYWLSYRSGGEEGSPGLDVLVDLPAGQVVSVTEIG